MKIKLMIAILTLLAMVSISSAQQQKKNQPQQKQEQSQDEKNQVEEEISGGDFVYKPSGRRDPFWDLLKGKSVKIKREAKRRHRGPFNR